ncbi:hypothetical protein caldi_23980 [Caldinitratiruptor microaerophilus]|uniref:Uncharacterized protein n=1 Tax=Caldinitratiruptor microaerophilus TaxID=671077 RepID=A0AA35G9C4_9FIRM|nr:hypothetical protein caldi_23980 [Caldinitratiruptor microaerophilus]
MHKYTCRRIDMQSPGPALTVVLRRALRCFRAAAPCGGARGAPSAENRHPLGTPAGAGACLPERKTRRRVPLCAMSGSITLKEARNSRERNL